MWAKLKNHVAFAAFLGVIGGLGYWAAVSDQKAKVAPRPIEHETYLREQTIDCVLESKVDLSDQRKLEFCRELVRDIDGLYPEARPYRRNARLNGVSQ